MSYLRIVALTTLLVKESSICFIFNF